MGTNLRIHELDFARSLCIFWIIGVWHLNNYLSPSLYFSHASYLYLNRITFAVLACFTFLSGTLLRKYSFCNFKDVISFFKKRIIRIYILYVIACLLFWKLGMIASGKSFVKLLLCVSVFDENPVQTLWYINMLFVFYAVTPLIDYEWRKPYSKYIVAVLLLLVLIYVFHLCKLDKRVLYYFPVYCIGLFFELKSSFKKIAPGLALGSVAAFAMCVCMTDDTVPTIYLYEILGTLCIISFSYWLYRSNIESVVSFVAYASMCAYLFHRPCYSIFRHLLGYIVDGRAYIPLAWAPLIVITIFVISFSIQYLYDIVLVFIGSKVKVLS